MKERFRLLVAKQKTNRILDSVSLLLQNIGHRAFFCKIALTFAIDGCKDVSLKIKIFQIYTQHKRGIFLRDNTMRNLSTQYTEYFSFLFVKSIQHKTA